MMVAQHMIEHRGMNHGSIITGNSVLYIRHNAPIKVLPLLPPCGQTRGQATGLD